MKKLKSSVLFIIMMFLSLSVTAQQSDFQIKSNFEVTKNSISTSIQNAISVSDIDSLLIKIDALNSDFSKNEEILNFALYPESFKSTIAKLKSDARNAEHRLLIIENQSERLAFLSDEVNSYKSELAYFTSLSDSLKIEIAESQENEKRLSRLVTEYRKSLEQRDDLIFGMVDSLFVTYNNMSSETIESLTAHNRGTSVSVDNSPLGLINAILNENINLLSSENNSLSMQDYLRIYALHNKVVDTWNKVGDDLVRIYAGNQQSKWKASIDDKLDAWKSKASSEMWSSLKEYINMQNVYLPAFDDNASFYASLDEFLNQEIAKTEDQFLGTESYEEFKNFREFWAGKVKQEWGSYVIDAEVLDIAQIASIDTKLETWGSESRPISSNIYIIFGICAVAVIGFVVAMVKKQK